MAPEAPTVKELDELLQHVSKGREARLREYLAAPGVDVNAAAGARARKFQEGSTPLLIACCFGHAACVRLLLEREDTDVNQAKDDGVTPLYMAAIGNARKGADDDYTECVRALLGKAAIEVNAAEDDGTTPLFAASIFDKVGAIDALLARPEIEVNAAQTTTGRTPLIEAAVQNHARTVQRLLAHPAVDVNVVTDDGSTALLAAAQYGFAGIAAQLLAKEGVDANLAQRVGGSTALTAAAQTGREAVVRLLLAHPGIAVNARERYGETALYWAAKKGHTSIVQALLAVDGVEVNLGAGPPPMEAQSISPLHIAATNNRAEVVRLLIADGRTDMSAETHLPHDAGSRQAFDLAVHMKAWAAAAAFRVTPEGAKRLQALFMSLCFKGEAEEAVALLKASAVDVTTSTGVEGTVLCALVRYMTNTQMAEETRKRQRRILEALLGSPDVDVNFRGAIAGPPLCIAAISPHGSGLLRRLLRVPGVDVNATKPWRTNMLTAEDMARDDDTKIDWEKPGFSALYLAAFAGNEKIVAILMRTAKVDAGLCDAAGVSPLQIARDRGHEEVAELIRGGKRTRSPSPASCDEAGSGELFGTHGSGGLFGASSTGALFGGSSGGLFGVPSATGGGLLFGAPPTGGLFGAPASGDKSGGVSGGGLFGVPTSGGGFFGAPGSGGGLFGASGSGGGLCGAPSSGGGLFGVPGSGGGGLFAPGSAADAESPGPSSSGGLFSAPSSGGGLFGAPSSGGGLFLFAPGSAADAKSPRPSSGGGLFGASGSGGGLFGASICSGGFTFAPSSAADAKSPGPSGGAFTFTPGSAADARDPSAAPKPPEPGTASSDSPAAKPPAEMPAECKTQ